MTRINDGTETGAPDLGGMDRRRFLTGAMTGATLMLLGPGVAACGDDEGAGGGDSGKVIGVNTPFRGADVFRPLMAGADEEAKRRGYQVLKSNGMLEAEPQLGELNAWIGKQVDAMTIYPVDVNSLGPVVERAHQQDIIVVAYAAMIPGADGATLFNEAQGAQLVGEAAAKWIQENLDGNANVALLTQNEQETSRLRVDRAVETMRKTVPDAKIVAKAEAADPATALNATQTILQGHPEVNVMICINDQDLIGASRALKQARREPESLWMGGFDGSREAMQLILDGAIVGVTAALSAKQIGATTIAVPANILEGKGPKEVMTDYVLVTNETADLARRLIADFDA